MSGINDKDLHPANKPLILERLIVFHFDISGKIVKDEQSQNKLFIVFKLFVFHF